MGFSFGTNKRGDMDKGAKGLLTLIGEGTSFQGTIVVPHSMRIDGGFKGKIEVNENITIGASGIVEADIKAKSAIIVGRVVGNLHIDDRVEIKGTASVVGDLRTRELIIDEGAIFHGNCNMEHHKGESV